MSVLLLCDWGAAWEELGKQRKSLWNSALNFVPESGCRLALIIDLHSPYDVVDSLIAAVIKLCARSRKGERRLCKGFAIYTGISYELTQGKLGTICTFSLKIYLSTQGGSIWWLYLTLILFIDVHKCLFRKKIQSYLVPLYEARLNRME